MAGWTDGPEYAPTARPDGFVAPHIPPLTSADAVDPASAVPPPLEPGAPSYQAPDAAPLDSLSPAALPERDPHDAFAVVSSPVTAGPGHAPAPSWTPQQPLALPNRPPVDLPRPVAPAPQVNPGDVGQDDERAYTGYAPQPPAPVPQPASLAALWHGASPGVWIGLLVGSWFAAFSPLALAASLAFATRARYRRTLISQVLGATLSGTAGLAAMLTVGELGLTWHQPELMLTYFYEQWSMWLSALCWLLVPTVVIIVAGALRRGEAPQ